MTTSPLPFDVATLAPLLALLSTALGVLIADLWRAPWRFSAWLSLTGMVVTPALALIVILSGQGSPVQGMLAVDGRAALYTIFVCVAGIIAVLLELGSATRESGPRYALIVFAVLGAALVAQSTHLLPMLISLAMLHVGLSALFGPGETWRYLTLQGAGLACTLLGTLLLYATAGTLRIDLLIERASRQVIAGVPNSLALLGWGLLVGGTGLLLGVVPFHTWFSDADHRARATSMLLATLLLPGTSIAILSHLAGTWPAPMPALLVTLGALSVLYGYAKSLTLRRVRGALAGIAIAQSGYLLLGTALGPAAGSAARFYALANQALSLACLWAASISARREDSRPLTLDDLAGLSTRGVWLAGAVTLCMLNLAGLPPLIGAASQLLLLRATLTQGYPLQAALAIAASLPAWLLAARWMYTMWIRPPQGQARLPASPEATIVALAAAGGMLLAGIYGQGLQDWIAGLIAAPY